MSDFSIRKAQIESNIGVGGVLKNVSHSASESSEQNLVVLPNTDVLRSIPNSNGLDTK